MRSTAVTAEPTSTSAPSGPGSTGSRGSPTSADWSRSARRAVLVYAAIAAVVIPASAITFGVGGSSFLNDLPVAALDLGYSFTRMVAAYAMSLGFALAYGYYAATRRPAERVMIPVLDILQSIPILGFFPVAIAVFIVIFDQSGISWLGPNFASVFLIFTSMSWNMVFGVYESLKSIPTDLREAADSFGSSGLQRVRRLLYPATVNRLVYNSILSWTGGWFFLVEAEIFTTGTSSVALKGIGSYLSYAAGDGNATAFTVGIVVLITLIAVMDFALWRPLGRIAERYRYDQAPSGEGGETVGERLVRMRRAAEYVTRGVRVGVSRISTPLTRLAAYTGRGRVPLRARTRLRNALGWTAIGAIVALAGLMLYEIGVGVYGVFRNGIVPSVQAQMIQLPLAMGASALRLLAAFAICIAIALPLALVLTRPSRGAHAGLPIIEVIASIPATAFFPIIIFDLVPYITAEGAAVLMLLTGMIWYFFFNLLAGLRSVPPDLQEAARSFGLDKRQTLRKVLLPGAFAAIVTGAITAFGGGWNTLIVAEYLSLNGRTFELFGVGAYIDIGYYEPNGLPLLVAALFTLVVTVVVINEVIWKPLYRKATTKYRYD